MKKVYVVSSGSYSDYHIVAIFSSKVLAEEFMRVIKSDFNDIEEFELDSKAPSLIKRGYSVYQVWMLKDGTVERIWRTDGEKYDIQEAGKARIWERTKIPAYKDKEVPDVLYAHTWAKTEKQAIKIVNEKRIRMIAEGEF